MKNDDYKYAINEKGKPVNIENITRENRYDCHYHCYGCGAELFPVIGDIREHHFRHEKGSTCDPNKYLHEFAKAEIKKRFDENDTFVVKYHAHQICKKANECNFYKQYHWPECECEGLYTVDLKQFYDTCTSEKGYYQELPDGKKRYVADLFLSHSQKPENQQVCIEVWVTHECTEDKKQNGGKIIEIKITEEKDAFRPIIAIDDEKSPIRFFNFKKIVEIEPNKTFRHIKVLPSFSEKVIVTDDIPCQEGLQFDPKGENEIVLSTTRIDEPLQKLFYAVICCKNGLTNPNKLICEYLRINKRYYECNYLNFGKRCPCKNFKYSPTKGEEVLKQFEKIKYWENEDIKG